eukprot:564874-Prymnesium_polylepis.1
MAARCVSQERLSWDDDAFAVPIIVFDDAAPNSCEDDAEDVDWFADVDAKHTAQAPSATMSLCNRGAEECLRQECGD